jgi:hypothetical protein
MTSTPANCSCYLPRGALDALGMSLMLPLRSAQHRLVYPG